MRWCCIVVAMLVTGCATRGGPSLDDLMRDAAVEQQARDDEQARLDAKEAVFRAMFNNPDLPAWHEQRGQLVFSTGDRRIEAPFDRVFDAFVIGLASLGCRVYQTERASGYIAATAPALPPDQQKALHDAALREYAVAKGYPESVIDPAANAEDDPIDMTGMLSRSIGGLTVSLIRQGDAASKAKLRFTDIYYPRAIEARYDAVWRAVDKQLFLDKGLD